MADREHEVIVIGAGPAGEVMAGRLGDRGVDVVIVENELVGGECSFYACMPSKALLRPAEALAEVRRVPGAAEAADGELDVASALDRRDEIIADLDDSGQVPWLEAHDVGLIRGHGRISGEREVTVVGEDRESVIKASKAVVVATGTGALMPPIDGLDEVAAWSNREITTTREVPERLIVLGGGAVGCEMTQAWSSLGSSVAIIEAEERLLPTEEPFAGEELAEALSGRGVEVLLGQRASKVAKSATGMEVELEDGTVLGGTHLLVAIGRKPLTDDIGLESIGMEPGGYLEVDGRMQVPGHDWLYAIGDVNGRSLLTHMGKYQGRIVADNMTGSDLAAETDDEHAPRVVFTEPQIAAVGHRLRTAEAAGINAVAVDVKTSANAGSSFHSRNTGGTTRLVIDEDRQVIVGATFSGAETADFLHAATIAIVGEVPLGRLLHAIPPFPTRSEVWLKLMEEYGL